MYSYTDNNPVNKTDPSGNAPGDLFKTMDAAARDFVNFYGSISQNLNIELGSFIYKITKYELVKYKVFGPIYSYKITSITYYTYKDLFIGDKDSVKFESNQTLYQKKTTPNVALVHTHAAYDKNYDNNNFSPMDKDLSISTFNIPIYVGTPNGTLRKYNPHTGDDYIISWDMPYDKNDPTSPKK